jgi:two-component system nitrate/nitrite response regulator NarL
MGTKVSIIIIEPRSLVREALASLMAKLSYRVVCSVESTADIVGVSTIPEGRKLIILGALSTEDAAAQANSVRKLWPDSKIMLLFEGASSADLQKLLIPQIDGFVPLFVSAETLSSMLDLIITQDLRVMIVGEAKHGTTKRVQSEEPYNPEAEAGKCLSSTISDEPMSVVVHAIRPTELQANGVSSGDARGAADKISSVRNLRLSEREAQILDGLVKGQPNKVIARTIDISEATVKVHMKSILRKIRVANRTQAAIWALENGYCADG